MSFQYYSALYLSIQSIILVIYSTINGMISIFSIGAITKLEMDIISMRIYINYIKCCANMFSRSNIIQHPPTSFNIDIILHHPTSSNMVFKRVQHVGPTFHWGGRWVDYSEKIKNIFFAKICSTVEALFSGRSNLWTAVISGQMSRNRPNS